MATNYYIINTLNYKIYDPEEYEKIKNRRYGGISDYNFNTIDKANFRHSIFENMNRSINSYRGGEMTTSGQDMSYENNQRAIHTQNSINNAVNSLRKEYIRIIKNCKNVLIEYDMFEEFKQSNLLFSSYFDLKEENITFDLIMLKSKYGNEIQLKSFLDDFICKIKDCVTSHECNNKKREKQKINYELMQKKKNEELELLYAKEFECMKLFDIIDKNKMKSNLLYIEYKKILELKEKYKPNGILSKNIDFLNYFTNEKQEYINELLTK